MADANPAARAAAEEIVQLRLKLMPAEVWMDAAWVAEIITRHTSQAHADLEARLRAAEERAATLEREAAANRRWFVSWVRYAYARATAAESQVSALQAQVIAPPWGYSASGNCQYCYAPEIDGAPHDHKPNCATKALESTVEAMARALEGAEVLVHEAKPALTFAALHGFGATSRQAAEGQARVDAIRAALASWRALTGKEGERG